MGVDLGLIAIAFGSSIVAAIFAVLVIHYTQHAGPQEPSVLFGGRSDDVVFLFDDETMIDATPKARALLAASPVRGGDWLRLLAYLVRLFPNVEEAIRTLPETGEVFLASIDQEKPLTLRASFVGGLRKVVVKSRRAPDGQLQDEALIMRATNEELLLLRRIANNVPCLVWQEAKNGDVIWSNAAYLRTSRLHSGDETLRFWPLPRLFSSDGESDFRRCLEVKGTGPMWFDIAIREVGDTILGFASSADAVLRAESTLHSFMQTLTKTFAQLPIGLAIFDRDRKLQLFNPALTGLTGLPVDFLSLRPSLLAVLDALRERKMLPEPKDYRSWRRKVVAMERAASADSYEETWNLADGQTFRVVGRPHPNGALALMIEDISTEMLRTRRFRADLELGQSVIDELDVALAVFAPSGVLVMSNAAYATLWGHDQGDHRSGDSVRELSECWKSKTAPNRLWSEVQDYVATIGDRTRWSAEARLLDGRLLDCHFAPLAGGATLATFKARPAADQPPKSLEADAELQRA